MRRSALAAIARKEFIQIRRDKATIYMVFIFPMMMLMLYGFGIRYDVKSVPTTVFDQDGEQQSRQYLERFSNSPYFNVKRYVHSYDELQQDIDRGEARIGIVVPPDFGARLSSNRPVDRGSRRSTSAREADRRIRRRKIRRGGRTIAGIPDIGPPRKGAPHE